VHDDGAFDPHSPRFRHDPHEVLAELRAHCPVAHVDTPAPFVALVREADVAAALKDTSTWSSAAGPGLAHEDERSVNILVNSDPPVHSLERKVLASAFRPRVVARLEPVIRTTMTGLLDRFAPRGRGDLMTEVVNPLPLIVVSEMVGVTDVDHDDLRRWVKTLSASVGYPRGAMPTEIVTASREMTAWCLDQVARRRSDPGFHQQAEDLLQTLLTCELDGRPLSDAEIVSFMQFILVAGTGTTSLLIGNLVHRLIDHPDQMALVRADPGLIDAAVEESLRYDAPALGLFRTPTRDVTLHGVNIPAGHKTLVMFGSANRDPEAWEEPDRFDVTRDLSTLRRHLAFGFGIHYCLGAPLARLEGRIALEEILARLPDMALDGEPTRVPSMALTGFDTLPIRWRPPGSQGER
jgi:cytochrome P450